MKKKDKIEQIVGIEVNAMDYGDLIGFYKEYRAKELAKMKAVQVTEIYDMFTDHGNEE